MTTEASQSSVSQSSETPKPLKKSKPATKKKPAKGGASKTKKQAKPSTRRHSPKKPAKKASAAARRPPGRVMQFPDKTILRLPKGSLSAINAKAKAAGVSQGAYLRSVLAKVTGKAA